MREPREYVVYFDDTDERLRSERYGCISFRTEGITCSSPVEDDMARQWKADRVHERFYPWAQVTAIDTCLPTLKAVGGGE